jgi:predicted O-methyltransferase YrrM
MLFSADDEPGRMDDFLLDLAVRAVSRAQKVAVADLVRRMKAPPYYPDVWPGEHYKLLASLVQELQPRLVIEIGTSTGLSALAMYSHLQPSARLVTFDITPWQKFEDTVLTDAEFADGRLKQVIADLGNRIIFDQHADVLRSADFIFLDGPKDGVFEQQFLDYLSILNPVNQPVLVFDDIRVWNMLRIWREIDRPKLDLTSFGHWSGTGLVHWVSV